MSGTRIKLCGMFRDEDIAAVNAVRPDQVGFVVNFPRSHRSLGRERLARLSSQVDAGIARVAVVVDRPPREIAELAAQGLVDIAQLHGHEDEDYLAELRGLCGLPLWQAFRVRSGADVERALRSSADLVLLDAGQGSGETFDWGLVEGFGARRPFVLAGGLTPDNVATAVVALRPWGVDMSSGIETDRVKDPAKMAAAVAAVRSQR